MIYCLATVVRTSTNVVAHVHMHFLLFDKCLMHTSFFAAPKPTCTAIRSISERWAANKGSRANSFTRVKSFGRSQATCVVHFWHLLLHTEFRAFDLSQYASVAV